MQDGRVNALYSTPSIYTDAKYATNEYWPLKSDDYFPWVQFFKFKITFIINCSWFLFFKLKLLLELIALIYVDLYKCAFTRYADRVNAYWTGYFTSRPAIKGYVRMLSGYYLVNSWSFDCLCAWFQVMSNLQEY